MTPEQIIIVGLIASLITQILKLISDKLGYKPGSEVQMVLLFLVSMVLAFIWTAPELPPISDPIQFALALLDLASGVVGFAALIYKLLLEKVVFPAIKLA